MTIVQSIAAARADSVGTHGIDEADYAAALAACGPALDALRRHHADGSLPLLRLPARQDDLTTIEAAARDLKAGATDIVFLGTGGSSLGAQALIQLAGYNVPGLGAFRSPRLHFFDNLDPRTFEAALGLMPLATTKFVAISKSGGTAETLMQTMAAIEAVQRAQPGANIASHFLGLTEPASAGKKNGLRDLLGHFGVAMLDHDPGVGGRFSVLTNVGLLPAAVAGLDIRAIRAGAARALAPVLAKASPAGVPSAAGAALSVALARTRAKTITVLMAYADRLERFTKWYVQLWAESLGKNGQGTTPVGALGPVDQHSQLQLFIAGPRDKLFTILTVDNADVGPRMPSALAGLCGESTLANKTIGDLVAAQGRATAETLAKNGCPVRTFHLAALDESALGELLMHFMLETIIAAHLLGVDAFDQPAVEEGKVLAKRYIAAG
jgi:glucose-6-phosphate isomerase